MKKPKKEWTVLEHDRETDKPGYANHFLVFVYFGYRDFEFIVLVYGFI